MSRSTKVKVPTYLTQNVFMKNGREYKRKQQPKEAPAFDAVILPVGHVPVIPRAGYEL